MGFQQDFDAPKHLWVKCPECKTSIQTKLVGFSQAPKFRIYWEYSGKCDCGQRIRFSPKQESLKAGFGEESKPIILR